MPADNEFRGLSSQPGTDPSRASAEAALNALGGVRFIGRRIVVPRGTGTGRTRDANNLDEALALLSDRLRRVEQALAELRAHHNDRRRRAAAMDAAGASAPE